MKEGVRHDSALGHVMGTSEFIDDRPKVVGELVVGIGASPIACGTLKQIDTEAARLIPGVVGIFTARDLSHNQWGPVKQDQPLLCEKEINYVGEPLCVVAASDECVLARALKAIRYDFDEKDPILSIEAARAAKNFFGAPISVRSGDTATAMAGSARVLAGEFFSKGQDHFYLESQAACVYPGEQRELTVHCSSQHPTEVQHVVAHALGLRYHEVVVVVKRMGGAFGGKESQASHYAALCALAAQKTKKPCRLILSKDEDMVATGKRHPFFTEWRVGIDHEGRILALEALLYSDGGAYLDLSTPIMQRAIFHIDNAYFLPNASITGRICFTNTSPNTAFRGFGGPQGVMVIEHIIEEIAATLGVDSLLIRERNLYGKTERNCTPYGQIVRDHFLDEIVARLRASSNYEARLKEVAEFNKMTRDRVRGLALTPAKFGISFTLRLLNQGNALVNVHLDGTIQVSTGATEMGQGVNTKIAIIVAEALGIPADQVRVMPTSTEKNHNTSATAASSGSDINGAAALHAILKIRDRLAEFYTWYQSFPVRPNPFATPEEFAPQGSVDLARVIFQDGMVFFFDSPGQSMALAELLQLAYQFRVSLGDYGYYKTSGIHFDWKTGRGQPFLYYTTGAAVSEVEVDCLTGDTKVLRTDILMDLARPINFGIDRGQVLGAFVQGMGWVTSEDLCYDSAGRLVTHSPTTYKIPNIQDIPRIFKIDFVEGRSNPLNVRGSKAVGEPPFLLCASVFAAIKKALINKAGHKARPIYLPATPEEVLKYLA